MCMFYVQFCDFINNQTKIFCAVLPHSLTQPPHLIQENIYIYIYIYIYKIELILL